jgi:pimeloyl-ACP methyl ester carboxylesterase
VKFIYHDLIINYETKGSGDAVILLHGWNADVSIYESIVNMLKTKYLVYIIDLPGFGESMIPHIPYTLDDYVDFVHTFIGELNIDSPISIGHSFGGRIAIRYVNKFKTEKLVLISSAGIKRFNLKTKYKICKYKLKKRYYILTRNITKLEKLQNNSGSTDYQCLTNTMKKTMINIINTNQTKELKNITIPTLLLWGKNDLQTPYKDALLMNKKITNSGLVTFNYSGHFPFIDEEYLFIKVLASFLEVGDVK